ncbi:SMC-Scp complex subunit ScpB [Nakamurella sp. YIM 132087]|uniref:SMC-Scp complex subunit ScpB n=1 Tax=Nakamurella alba TaxID=2665158 RepID=A0A7K1FUV5_9ACTN|nr:SMC-Scp complex subunit ScpB [Nakamurella alba]
MESIDGPEPADTPELPDAPEPTGAGDLPGDSDDETDDDTDDLVGGVDEDELSGALEAVLLVVDTPVTEGALSAAVGHRVDRVRTELLALAERYTTARSGIELRQIGGGWRMYTRDRFAPVVERFVLDGQQSRLSRAAMETLAVIAYRQPVTRSRIAGVRGVNVDGVIRTLTARGLIEEVGTDPDTGGLLYATTELFLERLGLGGVDELPSLGPLLPEIDDIEWENGARDG